MADVTIGDIELAYSAATDEFTVTDLSRNETVTFDGEDVHAGTVGANALDMPAQQTVPASPTQGMVYLDDGTNTGSGAPAFRYFDGTNWNDL